MLLSEFLGPDDIIPALTARDKKAALREMTERLAANGRIQDPEKAAKSLMERERLGSTGIGDGVAIPHAKCEQVEDIVVMLGLSPEGVEFDSLDGAPVKWVFLVLAPSGNPGKHLKLLARISRLVRDRTFCDNLLKAESPQHIHATLKKTEEEL